MKIIERIRKFQHDHDDETIVISGILALLVGVLILASLFTGGDETPAMRDMRTQMMIQNIINSSQPPPR